MMEDDKVQSVVATTVEFSDNLKEMVKALIEYNKTLREALIEQQRVHEKIVVEFEKLAEALSEVK